MSNARTTIHSCGVAIMGMRTNSRLYTRYYYNVTLVAKTACTTDVHFWSINPGVGPLLVCQYWTGGPLLFGQYWTGGPLLVRQCWTKSTFGPPILVQVHWSANTGPSSCYIDLYTVYMSGTIPASYILPCLQSERPTWPPLSSLFF